jgi:NADH-quinone oxidoreductase subunit G
MGADLRCADVPTIHIDLRRIGAWSGRRTTIDAVDRTQPSPAAGQAVLAGWHTLLDDGRLQDGEPHLAGTARPPVARLAPSTAAEAGVGAGDRLRVSTADGAIVLPVEITDMPDRVVWLPLFSRGSHVHAALRAQEGDLVALAPAPAAVDITDDAEGGAA